MNFSNFRHVDRPIFRSQMSRKWSQAAWPVPSMGEKAVVPSSWNMPVCEKLAPRRDILIYALDLAPERRRPAPLGEPALDLGRVRHLRGTTIVLSPWKRPRSSDKVSNEIRFLTSLVGKGPTLREPLSRMRAVRVVPPALRVPAEAVALGLY